LSHLSSAQRFTIGVTIALGAGICFGSSFNPCQYIIDHHEGSSHGIDYVFIHFTGIILTSLGYFLLYTLYQWSMGSQPDIYPKAILPALLSGTMWSLAMVGWFTANEKLGFSITFPIVTSTPGLIAAIWGVVVFGEIKGAKNLLTLSAAFGLTVTACLLIALSR